MIRVQINDVIKHEGEVIGELKLDLPLTNGKNTIKMEHFGKRFGHERIWDTKSQTGNIIEDRKIDLIDISIDGISFKRHIHKLDFVQKPISGEPKAPPKWEGNFNFNGSITISIDPNPLDWLIMFLHKRQKDDGVSYFSDHTNLFHYEDELRLISEIEQMLEGRNAVQ